MGLQRNLLGLVVGLAALGAAAQTTGTLRWRAGASPLGLQPAASDSRVQCGSLSLGCATAATLPLYTSPVAPRSVSMELGFSGPPAALKTARPQGLSVSLVGKAGIVSDLGVYGRIGTTFDRTPGLAILGGSERGLSYGVGFSWDFSRSASAVLGWDSYDVRGATGELRDVRATSLGLQWRY